MGEIEGLHFTAIQQQFGEKYNQWRSLDEQFLNLSFKGGESKRQVRTRVFSALNEYAKTPDLKTVAFSGHGILLMQTLLGLNENATDIENGAILHLIYENGNWKNGGFL